jgi:hypothetical protein
MPSSRKITQIQVELTTRDALRTLKTFGEFETYDDLIWEMIRRSNFKKVIEGVEDIKKQIEKDKDYLFKGMDVEIGDPVVTIEPVFDKFPKDTDDIEWEYIKKWDKYIGTKDDMIYIWDKKTGIKFHMSKEYYIQRFVKNKDKDG